MKITDYIYYGFLIVIVASGWNLLLYICSELYYAISSIFWPEADGISLGTDHEFIVQEAFSGEPGGEYTSFTELSISYQFSIDDKEYIGHRRVFGADTFFKMDQSWKVGNKLLPGTAVTVHYNPDNPDISVLNPGLNLNLIVLALIGIMFGIPTIGATLGALEYLFPQLPLMTWIFENVISLGYLLLVEFILILALVVFQLSKYWFDTVSPEVTLAIISLFLTVFYMIGLTPERIGIILSKIKALLN